MFKKYFFIKLKMVLLNFNPNIELKTPPERVMEAYDRMSPAQFVDHLRVIRGEEREIAAQYIKGLDGWRREQVVMRAERRGMFDRKYFNEG